MLRVLYLVFNEGYTGDVDLAAEAIRLTRQLASMTDDEETAGLLALMLLHHARRPARTRRDGSLVPLAEQDRSRWDTSLIAEGVAVLQAALARDRLGEFQAQAAIAALHADAPRAEETDWVQIVGWYDELLRLTGSPVVRLNRAVAVGEADGPAAGLAALATVDPGLPRHTAASAYLHEKAGDLRTAARLYADAARSAPNLAERHHLTRQAARISQALGQAGRGTATAAASENSRQSAGAAARVSSGVGAPSGPDRTTPASAATSSPAAMSHSLVCTQQPGVEAAGREVDEVQGRGDAPDVADDGQQRRQDLRHVALRLQRRVEAEPEDRLGEPGAVRGADRLAVQLPRRHRAPR